MKHTQGPWNVVEYGNEIHVGVNLRIIKNALYSDKIIAAFDLDDCDYEGLEEDEVIANFNLIGAAPELLEALKDMLSRAEAEADELADVDTGIARARAVIAKATSST